MLRREAIFHCCKWDPQVGDVSVLNPVPLVLEEREWDTVVSYAEALSAETLAAERELMGRPDLHAQLGLSRKIRKALSQVKRTSGDPRHTRLMRFDFHFTSEGWRISEVNSDVPGGFNEASGFSGLIAAHYPTLKMTGDPTKALAQSLIAGTGKSSPVIGLIHATAYTDDRQVMVYLSRELEQLGAQPVFLGPDHLVWENSVPRANSEWSKSSLDALFRFFPAEWLPNLASPTGWPHFYGGSAVPLCNPASALLTQSKRFPLVWDQLETRLPTWRQLLPETHAPSRRIKPGDAGWVFKPAMGRVGDSIGMLGVSSAKDWQRIKRSLWWYPREWVVQRRFEILPYITEAGAVYPCLGVYTVDSKVVGAYGRVSSNPLVNHLAVDTAVLVKPAAHATVTYPERQLHEAA